MTSQFMIPLNLTVHVLLQIPVLLISIVDLDSNVQKAPVLSMACALKRSPESRLAIPIFNAALAENVLEAVVINEEISKPN